MKKESETRGKPLKCKYCNKTFKISNIEEKNKWQNNKCICPLCGEEWCILPLTERKLKYLQEIYLQDRTESNFVPFLQLMYRYCQSLIKKNHSKALSFDGALIFYTNETITIMVEEYLSKSDFRIDISFAGFLQWKIKQAIFNPKNFIDTNVSLDYTFEDGNDLYELIPSDNKNDIIHHIELQEDTKILYKKIIEIIEGISEYCKDPYEDYIRTNSIYLYLKKGETAFDKLFQSFGRKGKEISLNTLDILRKELQKDLITHNNPNQQQLIIKEKSKIKNNNMILNMNELNGISW